jgi:hypothetical protein
MEQNGEIKPTDWKLYMHDRETGQDCLIEWGPIGEAMEAMREKAIKGNDVWLIGPDGTKVLP